MMKQNRLLIAGIMMLAVLTLCAGEAGAMSAFSVGGNGEIYTYRGLLDHFFQESGYTLESRLYLDSEYGQWLQLAEFKTFNSVGTLVKYQSYTQAQLQSGPIIMLTDNEAASGNYTVEILIHTPLKPLGTQILDVEGTIEGTIQGSGNPAGTIIGWGVNDCPDFAKGREYPGWFTYRLRLGGCIWIAPAIHVRNTNEIIYSTDALAGYGLDGSFYYPGRAFIARLKDVLEDNPGSTADDHPFSYAIFGNDKINVLQFTGNSYTDSYNSDIGPYSVSRSSSGGSIRSNSSILLTGNVVINGDATPGPGGQVDLSNNARVTGSTAPAGNFVNFPPVKDFTSTENLSIAENSSLTLNTGAYYYNSVSVTGNAALYINGKVEIYCAGDFIAAGNGVVNNDGLRAGVCSNLSVYVSGLNAEIPGNGKFFGTIYAPSATVEVKGNGNLYGSIIGRKVKVNGNAAIHWDRALLKKEVPGWWDPYSNSYVTAWEDLQSVVGNDRDYDDINYHITFSLANPVPGEAKAMVTTPKNGQTIDGNAVSIVAESNEKTCSVQFQFRAKGSGPWSDLGFLDNAIPYSAKLNASLLSEGEYELRAMAFDKNGNCEPVPDYITVAVAHADADIQEGNNGGVVCKKQKVTAAEDCDVTLADGTKVYIPYNALSEPATLSVNVISQDSIRGSLPKSGSGLSPIGVFRSFSLSSGEQAFKRNVRISIPYPDVNRDGKVDGCNVPAGKLGIFWLNEKTGKWEEVSAGKLTASGLAQADAADGTLEASVSHFSIYGLMVKGMATDLSSVKIGPNPFKPATVPNITFDGMTNGATVKIFNLAGELVFSAEDTDNNGIVTWDGTNAAAEEVASGVYYYAITDANGNKPATGKFLLIR